MKTKMRKEFGIGLLLFGIYHILNEMFALPEFISGFLLGLSICLELIGVLSDEAYQRLKNFKRALLHKKQ